MTEKTNSSKKPGGLYFLGGVATAYCLLAFVAPQKAAAALLASLTILWKLLPVIIVVIFLLSLFAYLFNPKRMAQHLGKASGAKAWFLALFGGILSHGPAFIWYPMLAEMRNHGVRDGLIVAFLYVRAIKIPWLPVMIGYFGWHFVVVLTCVLIVAALIQGWIVERFAPRA
jgi:uncharacterized membrane protein YraQ (UPF0718 family)